jgi:hypothetical protein
MGWPTGFPVSPSVPFPLEVDKIGRRKPPPVVASWERRVRSRAARQ